MPQFQKKNSSQVSSKNLGGSAEPKKWVVVELSSLGEKEPDFETVRSSAHRILKRQDLEVFIPAISRDARSDSQTLYFMNGYVFIEYESDVPYLSLRETPYFRDVLCKSYRERSPDYSLLSDSDLEPMRAGMEDLKSNDFRIGDRVCVITGTYRNLRGEISLVYDDGETVQVAVNHLRSKKGLLVDFPSTYLEHVLEKSDDRP